MRADERNGIVLHELRILILCHCKSLWTEKLISKFDSFHLNITALSIFCIE